jgi:hypothetical protein
MQLAHFLTVADIEKSARFYATMFDGRILSGGDRDSAPAYIELPAATAPLSTASGH